MISPSPPRYNQAVIEEKDTPPERRAVVNVGKMDAKKHLEASVHKLMSANVVQSMTTMIDTVVF